MKGFMCEFGRQVGNRTPVGIHLLRAGSHNPSPGAQKYLSLEDLKVLLYVLETNPILLAYYRPNGLGWDHLNALWAGSSNGNFWGISAS